MKALSIRQPWAHEIVHGPKRHENRSAKLSARNYRGPLLIHASLGCTRDEYESAVEFIRHARRDLGYGITKREPPPVPALADLTRGAIVGVCRVVGWEVHPVGFTADGKPMPANPTTAQLADIRWSHGYRIASTLGDDTCSFVLEDVEALDPVRLSGSQGIFNVDVGRDIVAKARDLGSVEVDELASRIVAMQRAYKRLEAKHHAGAR